MNKPASTFLPFLLAFFAAFSGTLLGVLTMPLVEGGVVNLVWGVIYGLGFWAVSSIVLPEQGWTGFTYLVVGAVIWPIVLTVALMIAFPRWINHQLYGRWAVISIVVSLFIIFPMRNAVGTFVYYLPLFSAFLENI
jgi:hypothetical protein